ncbi:MAG: hypothetical protein C5B49_06715 [Bdellovibrio sp.]|nr:MAG: hypothetical protein C5B49_06715 [Bdellovibrio sp.]
MNPMERICCVEDAADYQILIESALRGFEIVFCSTLSEAKTVLNREGKFFSLLILDISLPDGNGIRFLSEAKLQNGVPDIPVFVVTSDTDVMSKVTAFGIGIEDYICKPFEALELRARVDAKLKYIRSRQSKDSRIQFGDLNIDSAKMLVQISGSSERIELTPIEFKIIALLIRHPGNVYSRAQIIDDVWGSSTHITDRTVDAHISHLRKKLADSNVEISTVLSMGYKVALK